MATPYVGEIRLVPYNFAPVGWMFCQGQTLSIQENVVLFQLLGTTYGGDGQSTFQIPNLASRVAIGQGTNATFASSGGAESVTLQVSQMPYHSHRATGNSSIGDQLSASNHTFAQAPLIVGNVYGPPTNLVAGTSTSSSGGSQPHDNMQPTLVLNYIISLFGVFPSQN